MIRTFCLVAALCSTLAPVLAQEALPPEPPAAGAENALAAASQYLTAVKTRDGATLKRLTDPERMSYFDAQKIFLLKALSVDEVEVAKRVHPDTQRPYQASGARVDYTWTVRVDVELYRNQWLERAMAEALGRGMSNEDAQRNAEDGFAEFGVKFVEHVKKPQHYMIVVERDGRWFVRQFIDARPNR